MDSVISIKNLDKHYNDGFIALNKVNLDIKKGEIFALLGPNGAGKTTLISTVCGLSKITKGTIEVGNFDVVNNFKESRSLIGLVPQELFVDTFETVWATVNFSRGLFGKPKNPQLIEKILKDLSLWDKKDNKMMTLSGGMKRRVMIAKALSHEPSVLFLDEPTAGVDVELRKDMWQLVRKLKESGVTIILTTHYLEEAEEMADRIGVISKGELLLVEEKNNLLDKMGKKQLLLEMQDEDFKIPASLKKYTHTKDGKSLIISYDSRNPDLSIKKLIDDISASGIEYKSLQSKESSLEEIFVELVRNK